MSPWSGSGLMTPLSARSYRGGFLPASVAPPVLLPSRSTPPASTSRRPLVCLGVGSCVGSLARLRGPAFWHHGVGLRSLKKAVGIPLSNLDEALTSTSSFDSAIGLSFREALGHHGLSCAGCWHSSSSSGLAGGGGGVGSLSGGGGRAGDPIREGRPPFDRVSGFREWACFLGLGVHLL